MAQLGAPEDPSTPPVPSPRAGHAGPSRESGDRVDGRRAWRDRNRNAVVDALLDLYSEGNLRPGAQEVADRSGVSRRSVFRYFEDLDELARVAIERQSARVGHMAILDRPGEGSLEERIDAIVALRVRLYSATAPIGRVMRLRAPFERLLGDELKRTRYLFSRQMQRQFRRELDALSPDRRTQVLGAMDALCSFESFDLLREANGLNDEQVAGVLKHALTVLLGAERSP
jgi:AcrR family transcriptional regulator